MQDTAECTVGERGALQPLAFTDAQLGMLTQNISHEVIERVPGFRWWECAEDRKMNRSPNICGYVQRAWDFYWSIKLGIETGSVCVGIGTGAVGAPGVVTTDKYCGESPHLGRYPNPNAYSMLTLDADQPWPFHTATLGGVIMDHSFEHFHNQTLALQEAYRCIKPGGAVCILQPCMAYNGRGTIDPTHTTEWAADAFLAHLESLLAQPEFEGARIIAHNLIDTAFSFDTVIQKG